MIDPCFTCGEAPCLCGPYVCPGCHAVGGERCAPDCIDAEIEREREEAIERGDYDRVEESEDDDG